MRIGTSLAPHNASVTARISHRFPLSRPVPRFYRSKNSCELFGYDFMIDENYNPWLIEVNSSPACDYSTKVAERIVRSGLRDALKVVIEHRAWASSSSRRKGPPPDTGCWSKIHEGPMLTNPVASFGSDFEVKGSKLSRRQQKRI